MTHIALVTTSFPDRTPGSEAAGSFVADFAEELSRHTEITVVAPGLDASSNTRAGNLHIRRFSVPALPLSLLDPINPVHWRHIVSTLRSGHRAVEALARTQRIDHLFALWALPSGYWVKRIAKRYGIPYSVWALGSDIWSLRRLPVIKIVLRNVLRGARHCFADGYQLARDVEAISSRSCEFLPSTRKLPVQRKILARNPPYRLSFLGRWHLNKGVDILLESLDLLNSNDWSKIKEITIAGGGPLEETVRTRCAALQMRGHPVAVSGYLDARAAATLLNETDYLLLPSRIESIPVIFSDAMKSRCPVISMPVGDLPRLVRAHHAGVLSSQVSASSFAEAIQQTLGRNPSEFEQGLATAAEEFDVGYIVRRFLATINA